MLTMRLIINEISKTKEGNILEANDEINDDNEMKER